MTDTRAALEAAEKALASVQLALADNYIGRPTIEGFDLWPRFDEWRKEAETTLATIRAALSTPPPEGMETRTPAEQRLRDALMEAHWRPQAIDELIADLRAEYSARLAPVEDEAVREIRARMSAQALAATAAAGAGNSLLKPLIDTLADADEIIDRLWRGKGEAGPSLDKSGVAIIEGDSIVIRVAIEALPMAYDNSPLAARDQEANALYKVTDPPRFAKGVCLYLNDEEEDGTTPIHRMLDAAMEAALENGEEGIEEVPATPKAAKEE